MKYDVYGALKYVNLYFLCFYAADDIQTYEKLLNCYFFNSHANDLNENGVLSKDRVASVSYTHLTLPTILLV